jgi:aryl-alcohol dehydrogenase-like predicted oxidoreductase
VGHHLDESLRRLGLARIGLYYLHEFDPATPLDETLEAIERARAAGKIARFGVSNAGAADLTNVLALTAGWPKGAFGHVQNGFNLLEQGDLEAVIPMCAAHGLAYVGFSPLAGGLLTGKYQQDTEPAEHTRYGDGSTQPARFMYGRRTAAQRTWEVLDALRDIAEQRAASIAQIALAWVAGRPAVSSVILGARTLEQLTDNLGAADLVLSAEETETLTKVSDPEPADYPYGRFGSFQRTRPLSGGRGELS